ncbi:MAG: hypothetical protein M3O35_21335 [Acidobacteriota bacterium]|nr:hypothetical protein [Acidobacteriota bacterium]
MPGSLIFEELRDREFAAKEGERVTVTAGVRCAVAEEDANLAADWVDHPDLLAAGREESFHLAIKINRRIGRRDDFDG